jgi:hypothetical protein
METETKPTRHETPDCGTRLAPLYAVHTTLLVLVVVGLILLFS